MNPFDYSDLEDILNCWFVAASEDCEYYYYETLDMLDDLLGHWLDIIDESNLRGLHHGVDHNWGLDSTLDSYDLAKFLFHEGVHHGDGNDELAYDLQDECIGFPT